MAVINIKRTIRDALWRFFVRIDDSFVSNTKRSAGRDVSVTDLGMPGPAPIPKRGTMVLNDRWIITDTASLNLLFDGIFGAERNNRLAREVVDHTAQNPQHWIDSERVTAEAKHYLMRRMSAGGVDAQEALGLLLLIELHKKETAAARSAYSPTADRPATSIFWPDPLRKSGARSIFNEVPLLRRSPVLTKSTPVGSAGSCFAFEIAWRLQQLGFNYVVTERGAETPNGLATSSANWGTLFNVPSFLQLIERAYGVRELPRSLWSQKSADGEIEYLDPFREDVKFGSVEEYEASYEAHISAARIALSTAKVFIITLGVNEVWQFKSDGAVLSLAPWRVAPDLVSRRILTADENVSCLTKMLDIWRAHNPDLKLIVSVSPVPLHATFRDDCSVVVANAHSKAVLRTAAETFAADNPGVYYMPSYESVVYCTENAWQPDQRHVTRVAVDKVMDVFTQMFVADEPA